MFTCEFRVYEQVALGKGLKARGNVEDWLGKVEEAMFTSLRRLSKSAIADYQSKPRVEWVVAGHPSQVGVPNLESVWFQTVWGMFLHNAFFFLFF